MMHAMVIEASLDSLYPTLGVILSYSGKVLQVEYLLFVVAKYDVCLRPRWKSWRLLGRGLDVLSVDLKLPEDPEGYDTSI